MSWISGALQSWPFVLLVSALLLVIYYIGNSAFGHHIVIGDVELHNTTSGRIDKSSALINEITDSYTRNIIELRSVYGIDRRGLSGFQKSELNLSIGAIEVPFQSVVNFVRKHTRDRRYMDITVRIDHQEDSKKSILVTDTRTGIIGRHTLYAGTDSKLVALAIAALIAELQDPYLGLLFAHEANDPALRNRAKLKAEEYLSINDHRRLSAAYLAGVNRSELKAKQAFELYDQALSIDSSHFLSLYGLAQLHLEVMEVGSARKQIHLLRNLDLTPEQNGLTSWLEVIVAVSDNESLDTILAKIEALPHLTTNRLYDRAKLLDELVRLMFYRSKYENVIAILSYASRLDLQISPNAINFAMMSISITGKPDHYDEFSNSNNHNLSTNASFLAKAYTFIDRRPDHVDAPDSKYDPILLRELKNTIQNKSYLFGEFASHFSTYISSQFEQSGAPSSVSAKQPMRPFSDIASGYTIKFQYNTDNFTVGWYEEPKGRGELLWRSGRQLPISSIYPGYESYK